MFIIHLVISLLFHAEAKTVDSIIKNLYESHKRVILKVLISRSIQITASCVAL